MYYVIVLEKRSRITRTVPLTVVNISYYFNTLIKLLKFGIYLKGAITLLPCSRNRGKRY